MDFKTCSGYILLDRDEFRFGKALPSLLRARPFKTSGARSALSRRCRMSYLKIKTKNKCYRVRACGLLFRRYDSNYIQASTRRYVQNGLCASMREDLLVLSSNRTEQKRFEFYH